MKVKTWALALLLVYVVLVVYYPTLFSPFNSLDDRVLIEDLLNRDQFSLQAHFFPGSRGDYYRPLTTLFYELDKSLWGLEESFMHLDNILLHALNAVLIFLVGLQISAILGHPRSWLPCAAAAMFALHPLNTEAVNWITARADVFSTAWIYASLYALLLYCRTRNIFLGLLSVLAFAAGCLSKEPALFFLPGALLLLWSPASERRESSSAPLANSRLIIATAFCTTAAGYFVLRALAFRSDRGIENTVRIVSTGEIGDAGSQVIIPPLTLVEALLKATGFYFKKFFCPFPLNFGIVNVHGGYVYVGVLVLILVGVLLWRRKLLDVVALMGLFLAASALLVVINRIAWTPVAERYLYIASGPFILAIFYALAHFPLIKASKRLIPLVMALLLGASAYASFNRNLVWQDNLTLYRDTVSKSPTNSAARNELALALSASNQAEEAHQIFDSYEINDSQRASLNRIASLVERERYDEAKSLLLEKLESPGPYEPDILEYLVKVNSIRIEALLDDQARQPFYHEMAGWLQRLETLTRNPFHLYRLGRVYLRLGDKMQAQHYFDRAAKRLPEDSPYKKPAEKLAKTLEEK